MRQPTLSTTSYRLARLPAVVTARTPSVCIIAGRARTTGALTTGWWNMTDFPTDPLPIDPKAAADQMIRIFGDEAEIYAQRRIAHFLSQADTERATQWLMVAAHIREMQHGTRRPSQALH